MQVDLYDGCKMGGCRYESEVLGVDVICFLQATCQQQHQNTDGNSKTAVPNLRVSRWVHPVFILRHTLCFSVFGIYVRLL